MTTNAVLHARDPAERERYDSAADYAYAVLRAAIVEGRFPPSRRMRETELALWLGVSRTPTRQALSRLELEGLLHAKPRIGLVVSSLDDTAMSELYEMRSAMEGAAAAMAARHASARDIAALVELVETEVTLPTDPEVRSRQNLAFHQAIYAAAHNRFLIKGLQALNDAIALLGPTTMAVEGRPDEAAREHRAIVEAIRGGNAQVAEQGAREHVLRALKLRRSMRQTSVKAG
jgi:DNA-binding GntR family transcriptional regulator